MHPSNERTGSKEHIDPDGNTVAQGKVTERAKKRQRRCPVRVGWAVKKKWCADVIEKHSLDEYIGSIASIWAADVQSTSAPREMKVGHREAVSVCNAKACV